MDPFEDFTQNKIKTRLEHLEKAVHALRVVFTASAESSRSIAEWANPNGYLDDQGYDFAGHRWPIRRVPLP